MFLLNSNISRYLTQQIVYKNAMHMLKTLSLAEGVVVRLFNFCIKNV